MTDLIATAIRLTPNYVWRSYTGGSVLRRFRGGAPSADDHFPEDWLGSTVRARNGKHAQHPDEGLSVVTIAGERKSLAECLRQHPQFWWGKEQRLETGVLWKLLDSSVRLQIQAHPDEQFARQHLHSAAGKTECWYILHTRSDACVYLGFQKAPSREEWARLVREQRVEEMRSCFERIPVRPGDCYVVPAGLPHAIGEGVFMLEMQEPTDWVVRCEFTTAGLTLPPESCFMGLDFETCLDVFNYHQFSLQDVQQRFLQKSRVLQSCDGFLEQEIVSPEFHRYFRVHRVLGTGEAAWQGDELMLLIALRGSGILRAGRSEEPVCAGETWLLPGSIAEWNWNARGDWEILLAKLPTKTG